MAGGGVLGNIQQRLKPRAAHAAQRLVDPMYARREELTTAVDDIRRLLADQMTGEEEATATFGRVLAELAAKVDALQDEIVRLADQIEKQASSDTPGRRKR